MRDRPYAAHLGFASGNTKSQLRDWLCHAVGVMTDEDESKLSREEVNFANQVRRLREENGWKQEQLVEAMRDAGVEYMNKTAISRIENATRPVRMIEAMALARLFGKSIREMTNPDGREAVLFFASRNHSNHRKAFVAFKKGAADFARAQVLAKSDIDWINEVFKDRSNLDKETESKLENLLGNLRQLASMSLVKEAEAIDQEVKEARHGEHPEAP